MTPEILIPLNFFDLTIMFILLAAVLGPIILHRLLSGRLTGTWTDEERDGK